MLGLWAEGMSLAEWATSWVDRDAGEEIILVSRKPGV
jgi:hypothetical protein